MFFLVIFGCLHPFVMAKLATSSIRVKAYNKYHKLSQSVITSLESTVTYQDAINYHNWARTV